MSLVNLVSGGLDSTLIGVMAREEGVEVYPLFIDYGQRAARKEWDTCQRVHAQLGYWASCFPEGDGLCFDAPEGVSFQQMIADVRACFPWAIVVKRATPEG